MDRTWFWTLLSGHWCFQSQFSAVTVPYCMPSPPPITHDACSSWSEQDSIHDSPESLDNHCPQGSSPSISVSSAMFLCITWSLHTVRCLLHIVNQTSFNVRNHFPSPSPSGRGNDETRTNKKRPNDEEVRHISVWHRAVIIRRASIVSAVLRSVATRRLQRLFRAYPELLWTVWRQKPSPFPSPRGRGTLFGSPDQFRRRSKMVLDSLYSSACFGFYWCSCLCWQSWNLQSDYRITNGLF